MTKYLVSAVVTAMVMMTVGAARSDAGPITFNTSSLNPEVTMALGDTATFDDETADVMARVLPLTEIESTCAPSTSACPTQNDTFTGQDAAPLTTDFGTGFVPLTGGMTELALPDPMAPWVGSPAPTTETVVDLALDANPPGTGGTDPGMVAEFAGPSFTTDAVVDDPITVAAVPESGSLILVGIGLVAGARYLRRPKIA